jgi:hypothetical protein
MKKVLQKNSRQIIINNQRVRETMSERFLLKAFESRVQSWLIFCYKECKVKSINYLAD